MALEHIVSVEGVAAPKAPYSLAVIAGDHCYVSGQVALTPDGELASGDVRHEAPIAIANIAKILEAAGCSLSDVVSVTVLLADIDDFAAFNEVYEREWRAPDGLPARIAYQAGALPLGARVEVQCVAFRGR